MELASSTMKTAITDS